MVDVLGIDVSKWQVKTPKLTGKSMLFARASIGTVVDPRYKRHIKNARKAGLVVGAYHFNWDTVPVAAQVQAFLAAAGAVHFYFLDVEGKHAFDRNQTEDFIDRMHAAGKRCGLYHSASGYFDAGQDYDWVARWSSSPPEQHWDFWQYRGSPLDLNRFNGTLAQLQALAGIVPKWGPEVAADVRAADPKAHRVAAAIRKTGKAYGTVINIGDIEAALKAIGHNFGVVVNPPDVDVLLTWSEQQ
jgi:GH25 family lysozyme M1 (1,4-beta-N-acetylmuramidase)